MTNDKKSLREIIIDWDFKKCRECGSIFTDKELREISEEDTKPLIDELRQRISECVLSDEGLMAVDKVKEVLG